jgi:chemosensory pili system protein ChpE
LLDLFVSSIVLGLAFCAPPGTLTAEALRRGLARGFRAVLFVELGSLFGDATWAAIALVGAAFLVQNSVARVIIGGIGAFFLFRLSYQSLRDAANGTMPKAPPSGPKGDLVTGAMLSLTNPLSIGFWVGVGGGTVNSIVPNPGPNEYIVFYAGFMLACVFWCFFFSGLVAFCRQLLRPVFFRGLNAACGVGLAYFGVMLVLGIVRASVTGE